MKSVMALMILGICFPAFAILNGKELTSKDNPRILYATPHLDFYYQAHQTKTNFLGLKGGSCTGALINLNTILTAAHCVQDLATGIVSFDNKVFQLRKVVPHPQYREIFENPPLWMFWTERRLVAVENDIALIFLNENVEPKNVPALLPSKDFDLQSDVDLMVVGVGPTDSTHDPMLVTHLNATFARGNISGQLIEVRSENRLLKGDSGGPSYVFRNGQPIVIGIHSFGQREKSIAYDAYIPFFLEWIEKEIAAEQATPR